MRVKSLRQVVTAAADGAIAAVQVERSMSDYFKEMFLGETPEFNRIKNYNIKGGKTDMIDVDKTTFEEEVLKAEGYVFVDFYGDGCVPCQALMPKVHEFADTYGDKLKFTSLNTTKARRLAISQKVLGLPVMAIYKDGEKGRRAGQRRLYS